MGLIDSHAHLTSDAFGEDSHSVIDRAEQAGVEQIISIATDVRDAQRLLNLANGDPRVAAVIGIHPHEAAKATDDDWGVLERLMHDPQVVGLGEMGLDYHYDFAPRDVQQSVFERQLRCAGDTDMPIVIHSREAHADTVAILERNGFTDRSVVFHCFTGSAAEANDIADRGWRISFTGIVTFRNSTELQRIAADYPADKLMVETDSPYLSPMPVRHVRPNEPAHVVHVARFLADLRSQPFEVLAEQTRANTSAFFRLQ